LQNPKGLIKKISIAGILIAVILATVYWGFTHWKVRETREVLKGSLQLYGVAPTEVDALLAAGKRVDLNDPAEVRRLLKQAKRLVFATHIPSDKQLRTVFEFLLNSVGFKAYREIHNYNVRGAAGAVDVEALLRLLLFQLPPSAPTALPLPLPLR
jgi:hypothetical protein